MNPAANESENKQEEENEQQQQQQQQNGASTYTVQLWDGINSDMSSSSQQCFKPGKKWARGEFCRVLRLSGVAQCVFGTSAGRVLRMDLTPREEASAEGGRLEICVLWFCLFFKKSSCEEFFFVKRYEHTVKSLYESSVETSFTAITLSPCSTQVAVADSKGFVVLLSLGESSGSNADGNSCTSSADGNSSTSSPLRWRASNISVLDVFWPAPFLLFTADAAGGLSAWALAENDTPKLLCTLLSFLFLPFPPFPFFLSFSSLRFHF